MWQSWCSPASCFAAVIIRHKIESIVWMRSRRFFRQRWNSFFHVWFRLVWLQTLSALSIRHKNHWTNTNLKNCTSFQLPDSLANCMLILSLFVFMMRREPSLAYSNSLPNTYLKSVLCFSPEKVDVIISEPMGYMLLNERMLESFLHAKKWLKPNGKLYPTIGDLYCAPFTDEALYMEQATKANFW